MTTRRKRRAVRIAAAGVAALFLVAAVGPSVERAFAPKAWTEIPSEAVVFEELKWKRLSGLPECEEPEEPAPHRTPLVRSSFSDRCFPRSASVDKPDFQALFDRNRPELVVDPWFFPAATKLYLALAPDIVRTEWKIPVSESRMGLAELLRYCPHPGDILWCDDPPAAMNTDAPTRTDVDVSMAGTMVPPSRWPFERNVPPPDPDDSPLDRTLLAYDPLVFHVPADSPVTNLTTDQLRAVFVDRVPTWRAAGVDAPGRIFAYERDSGDRAQRLAADWLKGTGSLERLNFAAPRSKRPAKSLREWWEELRHGVRYDGDDPGAMQPFVDRPGAIGFSMMVQAAPFVEDGTIRLLSVDGVPPTAENIARGLYPVGRSLELVTYGILPAFTNNVGILRDYLRSEPGRRLLESAGYLPAPPGAPLPPVRENVW